MRDLCYRLKSRVMINNYRLLYVIHIKDHMVYDDRIFEAKIPNIVFEMYHHTS